jgi:molecular chaperone DnaK
MTPIVVRNTSIPTEKSLTVTTSYDNQSTISIIIFYGEDKLVKNNKKLGHFNINGI